MKKNRKNLLWVCERLDASCCYEWFCLLVSELTIRQIHAYQHPTGFTHPKDDKPSLRSKTISPILYVHIRWLDITNNVQHHMLKVQVLVVKCFLGLSSLLLFIAWKAVGGLGDCKGKLAYIRRNTKQQHERRRSDEQQQGGFYCFCLNFTAYRNIQSTSKNRKIVFVTK